MADALEMSMNL